MILQQPALLSHLKPPAPAYRSRRRQFGSESEMNDEFPTNQNSVVTSSYSRRCHCCPYGYHIDLDFVKYAEEVASATHARSPRDVRPPSSDRPMLHNGISNHHRRPLFSSISLKQLPVGETNHKNGSHHMLPVLPVAPSSIPGDYTDDETNQSAVFSDSLEHIVSDFDKAIETLEIDDRDRSNGGHHYPQNNLGSNSYLHPDYELPPVRRPASALAATWQKVTPEMNRKFPGAISDTSATLASATSGYASEFSDGYAVPHIQKQVPVPAPTVAHFAASATSPIAARPNNLSLINPLTSINGSHQQGRADRNGLGKPPTGAAIKDGSLQQNNKQKDIATNAAYCRGGVGLSDNPNGIRHNGIHHQQQVSEPWSSDYASPSEYQFSSSISDSMSSVSSVSPAPLHSRSHDARGNGFLRPTTTRPVVPAHGTGPGTVELVHSWKVTSPAPKIRGISGQIAATIESIAQKLQPTTIDYYNSEVNGVSSSVQQSLNASPKSTIAGAIGDDLSFSPFSSSASASASSTAASRTNAEDNEDVLTAIKAQMSASLKHVRELEEQVREIPLLNQKISSLKGEKAKLESELDAARARKRLGAIASLASAPMLAPPRGSNTGGHPNDPYKRSPSVPPRLESVSRMVDLLSQSKDSCGSCMTVAQQHQQLSGGGIVSLDAFHSVRRMSSSSNINDTASDISQSASRISASRDVVAGRGESTAAREDVAYASDSELALGERNLDRFSALRRSRQLLQRASQLTNGNTATVVANDNAAPAVGFTARSVVGSGVKPTQEDNAEQSSSFAAKAADIKARYRKLEEWEAEMIRKNLVSDSVPATRAATATVTQETQTCFPREASCRETQTDNNTQQLPTQVVMIESQPKPMPTQTRSIGIGPAFNNRTKETGMQTTLADYYASRGCPVMVAIGTNTPPMPAPKPPVTTFASKPCSECPLLRKQVECLLQKPTLLNASCSTDPVPSVPCVQCDQRKAANFKYATVDAVCTADIAPPVCSVCESRNCRRFISFAVNTEPCKPDLVSQSDAASNTEKKWTKNTWSLTERMSVSSTHTETENVSTKTVICGTDPGFFISIGARRNIGTNSDNEPTMTKRSDAATEPDPEMIGCIRTFLTSKTPCCSTATGTDATPLVDCGTNPDLVPDLRRKVDFGTNPDPEPMIRRLTSIGCNTDQRPGAKHASTRTVSPSTVSRSTDTGIRNKDAAVSAVRFLGTTNSSTNTVLNPVVTKGVGDDRVDRLCCDSCGSSGSGSSPLRTRSRSGSVCSQTESSSSSCSLPSSVIIALPIRNTQMDNFEKPVMVTVAVGDGCVFEESELKPVAESCADCAQRRQDQRITTCRTVGIGDDVIDDVMVCSRCACAVDASFDDRPITTTGSASNTPSRVQSGAIALDKPRAHSLDSVEDPADGTVVLGIPAVVVCPRCKGPVVRDELVPFASTSANDVEVPQGNWPFRNEHVTSSNSPMEFMDGERSITPLSTASSSSENRSFDFTKPRPTRATQLSQAAATKKLLTSEQQQPVVSTAKPIGKQGNNNGNGSAGTTSFRRGVFQSHSLRIDSKKGDALAYIAEKSRANSVGSRPLGLMPLSQKGSSPSTAVVVPGNNGASKIQSGAVGKSGQPSGGGPVTPRSASSPQKHESGLSGKVEIKQQRVPNQSASGNLKKIPPPVRPKPKPPPPPLRPLRRSISNGSRNGSNLNSPVDAHAPIVLPTSKEEESEASDSLAPLPSDMARSWHGAIGSSYSLPSPTQKAYDNPLVSSVDEEDGGPRNGSLTGSSSGSLSAENSSVSSDDDDSLDEGSYSTADAAATVTLEKQFGFLMSDRLKEACDVLCQILEAGSTSNILEEKLSWATQFVQHEWLKAAARKNANPSFVEAFMDAIEEMGRPLFSKVINMCDQNENTALHYAVSHGNFDIVSLLLDSKVCNTNAPNKASYTPVMLAALCPMQTETDKVVIQRLFQMGDVNIKANQHGQTALMLAVSHGRQETTGMLLEAGAGVNIQDEDGSTALMCAAEHGHHVIVKLLLSHPEIDASLADLDGSTALSIAVENGHRDIGVLIYAHQNYTRGASPAMTRRVFGTGTPGTSSGTPSGSSKTASSSS